MAGAGAILDRSRATRSATPIPGISARCASTPRLSAVRRDRRVPGSAHVRVLHFRSP